MRTIYKYPIREITDDLVIEMPKGARVLCLQTQMGTPCLWAEVDPEQPMVSKKFRLAGTGRRLTTTRRTAWQLSDRRTQ